MHLRTRLRFIRSLPPAQRTYHVVARQHTSECDVMGPKHTQQ
jgi:hypothetical protein